MIRTPIQFKDLSSYNGFWKLQVALELALCCFCHASHSDQAMAVTRIYLRIGYRL